MEEQRFGFIKRTASIGCNFIHDKRYGLAFFNTKKVAYAPKTNGVLSIDQGKIPNVVSDYEVALNKYGDSKGREAQSFMQQMATRSFNDGEYAYCILFTEKAKHVAIDEQWKTQVLVYSLFSEFAQNPTEAGWANFTNQLNELVIEIKDAHKMTKGGFFTMKDYLKTMTNELKHVETLLPEYRKPYIESIIPNMELYIKEAPGD